MHRRLARDYGIYENHDKNKKKKPGFSFVNVGAKPHTLPKLADLPFHTSAAAGGLMK